MPRLQVYLPDELYREVKSRGLGASELLQAAVRAEIHRLDLLAATDDYLAGVEPAAQAAISPADRQRAELVARRVSRARFA